MAHTNGHGAPRPQGPSQHCFALGMWGVVLHCWRSVLCLLSPVPRVIQFRLPAPWEQEGQFQPPSSLWMWIRGSLGVCLRIEEVARGRTRKRTKAARQNRTAVGPSPPRVTCEAGRLPTPARSQPEPLRPVTPSPQRLRRGGRLASLRPQSQRSPPAPPVQTVSACSLKTAGSSPPQAWIGPWPASAHLGPGRGSRCLPRGRRQVGRRGRAAVPGARGGPGAIFTRVRAGAASPWRDLQLSQPGPCPRWQGVPTTSTRTDPCGGPQASAT